MRNFHSWQLSTLVLGCSLVLACGGSDDPPDNGSGGSKANSGGSNSTSGGTNQGSGGTSSSSGGSGSSSGGSASGGANTANGGASTGSGGMSSGSGGSNSGGSNSGGSNSGGSNSGGAKSGNGGTGSGSGGTNAANGGASSGGKSSGGTSSGSGGAGMGGRVGTGGTASGGATSGSGGNTSGCTATGFYVQGGLLYDSKCKEFTMRGVNYPYAWFTSRNYAQDFTAIAATGANSVRIVMATGARWTKTSGATVTALINAAKAAKLVSVLEVHDTTGYSEQAGSVALSNATSYWTASDVAAALKGQEAFAIINIGNEPNGNNTASTWASSHVTAVQALRNAGFNHTLMVDGPDWAQDWRNTMRGGGGSSIWNADTKKNLVFSVHMYDVFKDSATVSSYFNTFLANYDAPLVVGEFAADHGSAGNVDEDTIMSFAETLGVGYLGWSWAGNGSGLATLDITNNFNASSLTTWGNRLVNGANGIKATSQVCGCFQ
ncbi:MAG: glycoside hydrolase family 5 protein [Myxococcota bacterium]